MSANWDVRDVLENFWVTPASSAVIEPGDLVCINSSGYLIPVSDIDEGSYDLNKKKAIETFVGIANGKSASGDTDPVMVNLVGIFDITIESSTYDYNSGFTFVKQSTTSKLEPRKLKVTSNYFEAVGFGADYSTSSVSHAKVELRQTYSPLKQNFKPAFEQTFLETGDRQKIGKASILYDFSVHGGAIGTINLCQLPANAYIRSGYVKVDTTFTSATDAATIAIGVEGGSTGSIVAAIAISDASNPWDSGLHDIIPNGTGAKMVSANAKNITLTIAVEALTAGKAHIYLEYEILG